MVAINTPAVTVQLLCKPTEPPFNKDVVPLGIIKLSLKIRILGLPDEKEYPEQFILPVL